MSQAEVGDRLGLSRSAITQIEAGKRDVSAVELNKFAVLFRRSPSALLADVENSTRVGRASSSEIEDLVRVFPAAGVGELQRAMERLLALCRFMTQLETDIGVDLYGGEVLSHRGTTPRTPWEAVHQGFAAADEERRRLDLGSAPVRDVAELLATLRIRTTRLALPEQVHGLFVSAAHLGAVAAVNGAVNADEQRFQSVHALAHLIFDRDSGWIVCDQTSHDSLSEIRANAFASRFLLPPTGVQRYLQSMGRDTLAAASGSTVNILSDAAGSTHKSARTTVSGRSRRGNWDLNRYELAQLAIFFGVTEELIANELRNLRHLSGEERDRFGDQPSRAAGATARLVMRFPAQVPETRWDPFLSRMVALAVEGRRRGIVSAERLAVIVPLLELDELARRELTGE